MDCGVLLPFPGLSHLHGVAGAGGSVMVELPYILWVWGCATPSALRVARISVLKMLVVSSVKVWSCTVCFAMRANSNLHHTPPNAYISAVVLYYPPRVVVPITSKDVKSP